MAASTKAARRLGPSDMANASEVLINLVSERQAEGAVTCLVQETLGPKGDAARRDVTRSARHTDTAVGGKELPKSLISWIGKRWLINPVALHTMWKRSRKAKPWRGGWRRWKEANAGL
jgi:hypothetical protein